MHIAANATDKFMLELQKSSKVQMKVLDAQATNYELPMLFLTNVSSTKSNGEQRNLGDLNVSNN